MWESKHALGTLREKLKEITSSVAAHIAATLHLLSYFQSFLLARRISEAHKAMITSLNDALISIR